MIQTPMLSFLGTKILSKYKLNQKKFLFGGLVLGGVLGKFFPFGVAAGVSILYYNKYIKTKEEIRTI